MVVSPELLTFAGRLATFESPKQINKRRASDRKKKQPTTATWLHKRPTPDQVRILTHMKIATLMLTLSSLPRQASTTSLLHPVQIV